MPQLKSVASKAIVKFKSIDSKLTVQYPHEWFTANHAIPSVSVIVPGDGLETIKETVIKGVEKGKMSRDVVKAFLVVLGETIEETLTDKWESYGLTIGEIGDKVTIRKLVKVTTQDGAIGLESGSPEIKAVSLRDTLIVSLIMHRLSRLNENASVTDFLDNVKKLLDNPDSPLGKNIGKLTATSGWQNDTAYNKLVAAYDMFLFKFPRNDYASARIGSITTRYRDCAGIMSVGQVSKTLGMEAEDLADWIFSAHVGMEMEAMFNDGDAEEQTNQYGYFPYQSDFGLVMKSGYSSVAVPYTFLFLHLVGTLIGSQRSIRARMNSDGSIDLLMKNAIIFAYALKSLTQFTKAFTEDGTPVDVEALFEQNRDTEEPEDDPEISSTNGAEWFAFMAGRNFKLTKGMVKFFGKAQERVSEPRANTIGAFVKNYNLVR